MIKTITFTYEDEMTQADFATEELKYEVEITFSIEKDLYGADADGNRGMWVWNTEVDSESIRYKGEEIKRKLDRAVYNDIMIKADELLQESSNDGYEDDMDLDYMEDITS